MQRRKREGILGTIGFHLGILVILILFGLSVPLPLPEEEGILLDFGTDDAGIGNSEPIQNQPVQTTEQQQQPQEESVPSTSDPGQNQAMTQDYEEAPAIKPQQSTSKNNEATEIEKETRKEEEKKQEQKKAEEKRQVNERALFPGKSQTEGSRDGITKGNGNQGSEAGEPNVKNYQTGESFGGGGISYNLAGRNPLALPTPEYNLQEEGIVVVEVTVNRNGEVINAVPGVKGSTTLDSYLLEMAKKAALKARFTSKSEGSVYQKGTITYHFILE
ncbi:MAG: TonB family protein [Bacteroidetes bacterium]|jgi:TonB family protein|nr:TonB family protein [Bacteroidota bacterium]